MNQNKRIQDIIDELLLKMENDSIELTALIRNGDFPYHKDRTDRITEITSRINLTTGEIYALYQIHSLSLKIDEDSGITYDGEIFEDLTKTFIIE